MFQITFNEDFCCETQKTVNTRNISGMTVVLQKKTNPKMTKLQHVTLIAFVVSSFFLWFHRASDWLKNNKHSRNDSLVFTVF